MGRPGRFRVPISPKVSRRVYAPLEGGGAREADRRHCSGPPFLISRETGVRRFCYPGAHMAGGDLGGAGEIGGHADPAGDLAPGTILGKYRIVELIGRGGMGVVYRAEHVDLGMLRALKTLAGGLAHHPHARSRFLKEARAAAQINHPHVVRVFDCGEHEGVPFFVMEHLDGEDLESAAHRMTLTVEQIAGIMLAVCAAIAEMHAEGLIHRDLKPTNIFLARNKLGDIVPTVLDFGIARPIERGPSATRTQDGAIVGTAHYMSPEQLADLPAGECTDQYSLGVTIYRCAAGALPFEGGSDLAVYRQIAAFQFRRPRALRPELPVDFEDLILRAMSERPADRFASVYDLGRELLKFASTKHRTLWTDYYSRVRFPKSPVSMPIPVANSAGWLPRPEAAPGPIGTAAMPPEGSVGPPSEGGRIPATGVTEPLPLDVQRVRQDASQGARRISPQGTPSSKTRPRLQAHYVVASACIILAVTGVLLWRRATPWRVPESPREESVQLAPASPSSSAIALPAVAAPPATPLVSEIEKDAAGIMSTKRRNDRARPQRRRSGDDTAPDRSLDSPTRATTMEKTSPPVGRSEAEYPRMSD
jgi:serine/threonine protein kinase